MTDRHFSVYIINIYIYMYYSMGTRFRTETFKELASALNHSLPPISFSTSFIIHTVKFPLMQKSNGRLRVDGITPRYAWKAKGKAMDTLQHGRKPRLYTMHAAPVLIYSLETHLVRN